jgi:hypothetical protein
MPPLAELLRRAAERTDDVLVRDWLLRLLARGEQAASLPIRVRAHISKEQRRGANEASASARA